MRFRPMPVLTVLSAVCVAILILLGNWQYDRFDAKMALADAPIDRVEPDLLDLSILQTETPNVQQVYGVLDGEPVWRRYVPVKTPASDEDSWALALLSMTGGPTPIPVLMSDVPELLAASMVPRDPDTYPKSLFANPDNPERSQWYTFDAANLASAYGFVELPQAVYEPVQIDIVSSEDATRRRSTLNAYAFETPPDPLPPERHFGYAMTWWGMAIALLGVYLAFHHARGRLRFRSE